jgi:hypothetical protein
VTGFLDLVTGFNDRKNAVDCKRHLSFLKRNNGYRCNNNC